MTFSSFMWTLRWSILAYSKSTYVECWVSPCFTLYTISIEQYFTGTHTIRLFFSLKLSPPPQKKNTNKTCRWKYTVECKSLRTLTSMWRNQDVFIRSGLQSFEILTGKFDYFPHNSMSWSVLFLFDHSNMPTITIIYLRCTFSQL